MFEQETVAKKEETGAAMPVSAGDERQATTALYLDDLHVGAQGFQLIGWQLDVVQATQLENGLRTDVAIQMAVQVGQGEGSVNHDGAFCESGWKACHSRRGS